MRGLLKSSVPHGPGGDGAASATGLKLCSSAAPINMALAVARPHNLIAMIKDTADITSGVTLGCQDGRQKVAQS